MAITLTEKAAKHINRYIERRGKGVGLRFGVRTTGCSGLAYKLEYVDEAADEDNVFESHGVKVFVDPKSLPYIDGTELDFAREGLNEGFRFNNATHAEKRVAMQWATRANEAYQTLKNPHKRAQYLCELHGVDLQTESNTTMPSEFLM